MRENLSGAQSSETDDEIQDGEIEPLRTSVGAVTRFTITDIVMNT